MKKIYITLIILFSINLMTFAKETQSTYVSEICYEHDMPIQKKINEIGFRILNANMLDKHITFSYNSKDVLIKGDSTVLKRQITLFGKDLKHLESDDEVAAFLSREISNARKSFDGSLGGFVDSMQIKMAPKKYEIVSDLRAVDYMVKAGYNPLGLITFINKAYPQARQDTISTHNLSSKRMMHIYERIYTKYPIFISNNSYINNEYYQNFLLNSSENRKKLQAKIKNNSNERIKYE